MVFEGDILVQTGKKFDLPKNLGATVIVGRPTVAEGGSIKVPGGGGFQTT